MRTIIFLLVLLSVVICTPVLSNGSADSIQFICGELLGRPTDHSITLNICADKDIEAFVEYGTLMNTYTLQTAVFNCTQNIPFAILLSGLQSDTKYFYRLRWRFSGTPEYAARPEHSFRTARPNGRPFSFAIEADPHLDTSTNPILLKRTFTNILAGDNDFMLDLGDTFMSDKLPVINQAEVLKRNLLLRTVYDTVCHSVPLMMVQGNHDGELGWLLNGTANTLPVWAANIRKSYYPQPFPDGFYTGDTTNPIFVGQRQNYYAWEWGNALFVVLDPYWYTVKKPGATKNNWDWTLGKTQYDWFQRTLKNSKAIFKLVFAHQIVGGVDTEGRGGIEGVPFYEMGGLNSDSSNGFSVNRPGWEMPLHQLMVKYHVSAFFHGHDHIFVKQDLDGIVYQELPQPGYFNFSSPDKSYSNTGVASGYGYTHGTIISSSGYLKVTVSDTSAVVDYIRTYLPEHENAVRKNGTVAFSYVIKKNVTDVAAAAFGSHPFGFTLHQNYPNPFNPVTTIQYAVPHSSSVTMTIRNSLGQEVARLVDRMMEAGNYSAVWDGSTVSSGIYFCTLSAGSFRSTIKMILLK